MNPKNNQTTGKIGEQKAASYLREQGYQIIETNFLKRYGEIDIVATEKNTLVFIEVRTRIGDSFGLAEESLTRHKIRSLTNSANYYKNLHPRTPDAMRIDLVAIDMTDDMEVKKIELYKNITGF
jgi:putative endonuclease